MTQEIKITYIIEFGWVKFLASTEEQCQQAFNKYTGIKND